MTRRSKFTEGKQRALIQALRAGMPLARAGTTVGVSETTIRSWLAKGRAADAPHHWRLFAQAVDDAISEGEYSLAMIVIEDAIANRNVRSAMWLLERRFPERWARQASVKMQHSGEVQMTPRQEIEAARARRLELVRDEEAG